VDHLCELVHSLAISRPGSKWHNQCRSKFSKKSITSIRISPHRTNSDKESTLQPDITILDAHVHIHDCFDISDFLDHAYDNFRLEAELYAETDRFNCAILLTESFGTNWFNALRQSESSSDDYSWKNWRITTNDEAESLTATSRSGQELSVVAGRQIVTAENLEILAIGLDAVIDDGLPIDEVIRKVQASDALCVLPWGFGKWIGRRGQIVRDVLSSDLGSSFFIGDNAGRLALWPEPVEFKTAARRNVRILPGSDPLPYKSQVSSVGRFGLVLDRGIDISRPFRELRRLLLDEDSILQPYGSLERLLPFIRYQIGMQLRKFVA